MTDGYLRDAIAESKGRECGNRMIYCNWASLMAFLAAMGGEIFGAPYDRMIFFMAVAIYFKMWAKGDRA
jgi:hypothetical protein